MPNINLNDPTEKRISLVYNSEISGYQAIDFSKIDGIESILQNILVTGLTSPTGLAVYQVNLNKNLDQVTTFPEKRSTISNQTPSGTNGIVLNENINRQELYIQNLSTGALYVKYGQTANSSSFNFILAGNTSNNAGDGGSLSDKSYTGIVSVSGVISTNYISWERA